MNPSTLTRLPLAALTSILLLGAHTTRAEESVRGGMNSLLGAFRELQPYIVDQERFSDEENHDEVAELLQTLRSNFHKMENLPSKFQPLPGFKENIQTVKM